MSIIKALITDMRYEIGDTVSDYTIMYHYNKGNKILRETIRNNFPLMLAEIFTGTCIDGTITFPKNPIKIIETDFKTDTSITYKLVGLNTLKLSPVPDKPFDFTISYIPETETKLDMDDSGYQTDVEELLVKYVVAMVNGQSLDIVAEYNNSIGRMLGDIEPNVPVVRGYYDC